MKKIVISSTLILLFIYGCQDKACQLNNDSNKKTSNGKMNQLEWIIGSWSNISPKGQLCENWIKTNDSVYTGNSFMVVKNDTVFSEMISLENRNGQIFYIPTVKNENNGQAVLFKLLTSHSNEVVFENKAHDFPQRIMYKNPVKDSLYARVEGMDKDLFREEEFFMKRVE